VRGGLVSVSRYNDDVHHPHEPSIETTGSMTTMSALDRIRTQVGHRAISTSCQERKSPRAHSITSSARPSNDCGNAMPSVFAVLRLIANSVIEDCFAGRSAAFSSLRMRPADVPSPQASVTLAP
jgi:hypothetical protein